MRINSLLIGSLLLLASPLQANDSPEALQQAFMDALLANDAAAMAANYAEDAVTFQVGAMSGTGPSAVAEDWGGFFSAYTVVSAELSEKRTETHGEIAFAWGLFKIMAEPAGGGEVVELAGRYTDVSRNFDGSWLYIHDHASMPAVAGEEEAE